MLTPRKVCPVVKTGGTLNALRPVSKFVVLPALNFLED
jgi:hypothetical protein